MTPLQIAFAIAFIWLGCGVFLFAFYRFEWVKAWREPVLGRPILVLESDDWGAGPLSQALALSNIDAVLQRFVDGTGHQPVLSLAVVLSVPDPTGQAVESVRPTLLTLDAAPLQPVLVAMQTGIEQGVLAVQLHGMAHFWPPALLASTDLAVKAWLQGPRPAATEQLPSHWQSRWVDSTTLPSRPLPAAAVQEAVAEEVAAFARIFGTAPAAVVPPTFVWTREVERAWAAQGVEFIVTPGWRYTQRNAAGQPAGDEGPLLNGDSAGSLTYLVRTDYFEPARGRGATHALKALDQAVAAGRPCVLENHRENFIFDEAVCRHSLAELDALCRGALRQHPGLRFLSTVELGRILRARDPQWVVHPWRQRLPWIWQRLRASGRPWKLMRLTGLAALGTLLVRVLGQPVQLVRPVQPD